MEIEGIRKRKVRKEKRRKSEGEGARGFGEVLLATREDGGQVIQAEMQKKKKKRRIGQGRDAPDQGDVEASGDSRRDSHDNGKKARRTKSNMSESDQALDFNEMEINLAPSSIGKSKGTKSRLEKAKRKERKGLKLSGQADLSKEKIIEPDEDGVHNISSGDEDSSKGMKKWLLEYYQKRPGLKELQQRIDEFIVDHEAKLEQERKEREARAAEGGWTVVTHHKGRKKTTEAQSGVVVGSVSQAATEEKMAKKKRKEVGLNFYRFQRKEAQRNELMMLQSKFEQDKKRIQELRAARKFRPF